MAAAPVNIVTATSLEPLSENQLAKPLPDPKPQNWENEWGGGGGNLLYNNE